MLIFPAIDIIGGRVVRLAKGDYAQVTVYGDSPLEVARAFEAAGATCIHMVDLDGAKSGTTPNLEAVLAVARDTSLFVEVGGGVRSMEVVRAYLDGGVDRVIIGTAAVTDPAFLAEAVAAYGERVAVGVDLRDGFVAIHGWTETSALDGVEFCRQLEAAGVRTVIVTDISRDGVLSGCNVELYRRLGASCGLRVTASGGVSSLEDVRALAGMGLYAAIVGKAYYEGRIDLAEAIRTAEGEASSPSAFESGQTFCSAPDSGATRLSVPGVRAGRVKPEYGVLQDVSCSSPDTPRAGRVKPEDGVLQDVSCSSPDAPRAGRVKPGDGVLQDVSCRVSSLQGGRGC